jgi:hypothetical protein
MLQPQYNPEVLAMLDVLTCTSGVFSGVSVSSSDSSTHKLSSSTGGSTFWSTTVVESSSL